MLQPGGHLPLHGNAPVSWLLLGLAHGAELELHAYGALGDAPVRSA